ncbi:MULTISPECIES: SPOR domain-containing protein [Nitrosomonas]|uniref:Sporulation related protein n=2 Tax=Nitrosomonas eutropha TaxID=916 RepID=A0ABX5MBU4_9PROT|nr:MULTISPECIES: SPOR domain-containing protein [Nitrosomonas]ABI59847.1 Sporulation domain protein [Nitrosomonas eutropha C91]MXS80345.1 SPOR domain-containing protein [Nitrosomonas sp. GH22]PXV83562.1 sporulation related protein [Nitrosomonas eutropha]SCW99682.1 Sporulation related domain-containing protein [Nitrosomonas eutropha]SDW29714.1 Sporulation related domain-containing protein [Nitrosomonas eutropha]
MSRDYKSRNSVKTRKNGSSLWLGLFVGYTLGLVSAIGVWLYISQAPSPFLTQGKETQSQSSGKSARQSSPPLSAEKKIPPQTNQAETSGSRFDFYKILPGIEEPPAEDTFDLAPLPPTAAVTKKTPEKLPERIPEKAAVTKDQYYLQAGSFKNAGDAERMKAELAMLGIIASVQLGRSDSNVLVHRVRVGPFTKMEELDRVRASLQSNGITTSLVRAAGNN